MVYNSQGENDKSLAYVEICTFFFERSDRRAHGARKKSCESHSENEIGYSILPKPFRGVREKNMKEDGARRGGDGKGSLRLRPKSVYGQIVRHIVFCQKARWFRWTDPTAPKWNIYRLLNAWCASPSVSVSASWERRTNLSVCPFAHPNRSRRAMHARFAFARILLIALRSAANGVEKYLNA